MNNPLENNVDTGPQHKVCDSKPGKWLGKKWQYEINELSWMVSIRSWIHFHEMCDTYKIV